jgi:hypothetical protein
VSEARGNRFKERTGQTYGYLTVLRFAGHNQWRQILWECVCCCGARRTVRGCELHNGQALRCGTSCPRAMHHAARDLHGLRFGALTIIKRAGSDADGRIIWECRCDCGQIVNRQSALLNDARTCGCDACATEWRRQSMTGNVPAARLAAGEAAFRALVLIYRRGARKRGLEWALDTESARALFAGDCFYCGAEPDGAYEGTRHYGAIIYNGIDRTRNEIGYRPENCVSCCKVCNRAKLDMPLRDFLIWARRLGDKQLRSYYG